MRFSWDSTPQGKLNHRFEWELDGIAHAAPHARDPRRLPYLFTLGPVPYETLKSDELARAEAAAVAQFLDRLAAACPPGEAPERWTADARLHLFEAYEEAWVAFSREMAGQLVGDPDRQGQPKRIALRYASEGRESDPPPCLVWDSRTWDAATQREGEPDTSLLKILYWRPGYITPEYFVDRLFQELNVDAAGKSRFERVIFDDISQLGQRFPLLAKSPIFLPTLIDSFKSAGITSAFLGDTGSETDRELSHGVATMADHVIRTKIRDRRYLSSTSPKPSLFTFPGLYPGHELEIDPRHRAIVVEIEARPGARQQAPHHLVVRPSARGSTPGQPARQEAELVPLD